MPQTLVNPFISKEAASAANHVTPFEYKGHQYVRLHFTSNGNEYHDDPVIHEPDCAKCAKEGKNEGNAKIQPETSRR